MLIFISIIYQNLVLTSQRTAFLFNYKDLPVNTDQENNRCLL